MKKIALLLFLSIFQTLVCMDNVIYEDNERKNKFAFIERNIMAAGDCEIPVEDLSKLSADSLLICFKSIDSNTHLEKTFYFDFSISDDLKNILKREFNADISTKSEIIFYNIPDHIFCLIEKMIKKLHDAIESIKYGPSYSKNDKQISKIIVLAIKSFIKAEGIEEGIAASLRITEMFQQEKLSATVIDKIRILEDLKLNLKILDECIIRCGAEAIVFGACALAYSMIAYTLDASMGTIISIDFGIIFVGIVLTEIAHYLHKIQYKHLTRKRLKKYSDADAAAIAHSNQNYSSTYLRFLES